MLPGVGNVPCSADCAFDLLPGAAWVFAAAFAAVHFELGGCFDFEASNSSSVAWGAKKKPCQIECSAWVSTRISVKPRSRNRISLFELVLIGTSHGRQLGYVET